MVAFCTECGHDSHICRNTIAELKAARAYERGRRYYMNPQALDENGDRYTRRSTDQEEHRFKSMPNQVLPYPEPERRIHVKPEDWKPNPNLVMPEGGTMVTWRAKGNMDDHNDINGISEELSQDSEMTSNNTVVVTLSDPGYVVVEQRTFQEDERAALADFVGGYIASMAFDDEGPLGGSIEFEPNTTNDS